MDDDLKDTRAPASPAAMLQVSNLVTYASLACGLLAVGAAVWYRSAPMAGLAMALSVVADTFDGRFARLFERTAAERQFGAQLDSLADAVCSGLVPVTVLASIVLPAAPMTVRAAWGVAALFYLIAVVTRLGFYNLFSDGQQFIGLPAPVGALAVATLLLFPAGVVAAAAVPILCGTLMLAPFRIMRPKGWRLLVFVAWAVAVVAVHAYRLLGS